MILARAGVAAGLVAGLAAACSSGPPAGFAGSAGDRWTFPLAGALEDGLLIAPVLIDGRGPYLFALDPDANVTIVDEELVKELKLNVVKGPARVDEAGATHPRFYADVRALELGSLIIERRDAMVVTAGTFDASGRRIHGVIGKDVLSDALVFGFDRDQGLGFLTAAGAFTPPPGATRLAYQTSPARNRNLPAPPLDRRVVRASIGGHPVAMHLDLGAPRSQLREARWPAANLVALDAQTGVIDEVGTARRITRATTSDAVAVDGVTADKIVFLPYEDTRFGPEVDGALGLDFFRGYDTWAAGDAKAFYVARRTPVPAATRIARWEIGALAKCTQVGCVTLRLVDPLAGKPVDPAKPHPGVVLSVTREEVAGGMELEVVVQAKDRPALPWIVINLMPSADRVIQHLKGEWVGATLEVVDASPYPRRCASGDGCVDLLAR